MVTKVERKWLALALLCGVQFMVVLDIAIVNVALPSIQVDLGFAREDLQWVISAYALVFGGFLLLGGRAADLFGRRRVFLIGLPVFTAGSLLCGLAWDDGALVAARGIQGLGAAIISPAALAILMTTFAEGRERNTALGVWGAVGGFGAVAGVLLGGVLTDAFGWEWVFFVNVPMGALALAAAPLVLGESRDPRPRAFDLRGAALVTAGLIVLVYAITEAPNLGWGSLETIGLLAAATVLLAAFAVAETHTRDPLISFSIFRIQSVAGANIAAAITAAALFSQFLLMTLYMQQVLGYSPMTTGVAYLATAGSSILWANVSARLVTRIGVRPVLAIGLACVTAGNVYFTQVSVGGSYVADLLPGFLLIGLGLGFSFVPITIAALAGVEGPQAGLASGLITTSQQIGGALGVAALSTLAASQTADALAAGTPTLIALTDGLRVAFGAAAAVALAGVVIALVLLGGAQRPAAPGPVRGGAASTEQRQAKEALR